MATYDTQRPYIASYVIIKNEDGHIGFVLRSNTTWMNDHYGLPSGKIENNETFTAGAQRELKEEVGLDVPIENIKQVFVMHRYSANDKTPDTSQWVDVYFEVSDYEGEPYNAEPDIHSEFAWLDPDNLPDNIIPDTRAALEAYSQGKSYFEWGFDD